jgi:hypothetical protein
VHHQITSINYQVITLHTEHANFNYDISTMDLHIKEQIITIFYGMVYFQDPVENKRNPLGK